MASIETEFLTPATDSVHQRRRRQTTERLILAVTSLCLVFALAITFGIISG